MEDVIDTRDYRLIGASEDGKDGDLLDGLDAKASRQRLQALISGWLRMENLVVLTGAGTSCSSGGKIMTELEKSVVTTVRAVPGLVPSVAAILDERLVTPKPKDAIGFESWLSFLVNASHLASYPQSPFHSVAWKNGHNPSAAELSALVSNLGKAIMIDCALTLGGDMPTSVTSPHLAFLAKLVARDSNLGRAHLFTLNYDTVFEQALELLGIQYFDGFTGRANARFDPSVYGLDIYWPGEVAEGRVRRFDKFLHFYKLHGSIHWQFHDQELRARHPDLRAYAKIRAYDAAKRASELDKLPDAENPVGILPTANKFAQALTMPFAHLFRSFQIRLGVPQTFLLVMGYGFGDEHATQIIETALMNPSLVMLVIEPNPKSPTIERIQKYKELGKRAFVLTATDDAHHKEPFKRASFDDFAQNIMPDVQWLDDFLRLRRFEKQIQKNSGAGEAQDDAADSDDADPKKGG